MASACSFEDPLRKDTKVFLKFKISIFEICLHPINFNFTPYFLTSSTLTRNAGTSGKIPFDAKRIILTRNTNHFSKSIFLFSCCTKQSNSSTLQFFKRFKNGMQKIHSIQLALTYFMWSNYQASQAHNETSSRTI